MAIGNWVIAAVGATVIALSLSGLMEIGARAGPYEVPVRAIVRDVASEGSYLATGPQGSPGPGGVCIPSSASGCAPARLEIQLRLRGLPPVPAPSSYVGFLVGGEGGTVRLAPLKQEGDAHSLAHSENRDARTHTRILVTLEASASASAPGALLAWERDVSGQGRNSPAPLAGSLAVTLAEAQGRVRVAEIGAVSKSVTAVGRLDSLELVEGWTHHAWFESLVAPGTFVPLGEIVPSGGGAEIDARVERLRLEDQSRFLVTLEPAGRDPGSVPSGPAVLEGRFIG